MDAHRMALRTEALHYHYNGEIPALNGVDVAIPQGAFLAIVGQNGSGKTTLVKHFNGLLRPTSGRVWVFERDTATATVGELARLVGYVFQNPDHQIFCATTREEISFGPRNLGLAPSEVAERTEEALEAFGLRPYAELPPAVLSFGLRRVISTAAVYAMRPQVFILDEPTAGLDWRSAHDLLNRMARLNAEGHTILLVTHDMQLVAEYCPEMLILHEGRILAYGETRTLMGEAEALARAQITPPQVTQLAQRLRDLGVRPGCLTVEDFCAAYGEALERARRDSEAER
jgi:energy-coupling factor transporter ATP-binding protein EcfA2